MVRSGQRLASAPVTPEPAGGDSRTSLTPRVAVPEDAPRLGVLLRVSYTTLMPPAYDESLLGVLDLMTRPNPALLASGTFYVVESAHGSIVGCGGWTRERPGSGAVAPGLGHLRHFATHPDWLRRGIARRVHAACEAGAREAGITRIECYASLNAEAFYAAMGFAAVARVAVPMGPGRSLAGILMRRVLVPERPNPGADRPNA